MSNRSIKVKAHGHTKYVFFPDNGNVVINGRYTKRFLMVPFTGEMLTFRLSDGEISNTNVFDKDHEIVKAYLRGLIDMEFEKEVLDEEV